MIVWIAFVRPISCATLRLRGWEARHLTIRRAAILLALSLGLFRGPAAGADRERRTLAADEGLPVREVGALAQDHQGFLWIGAGTEVVRYDGYRVERFTHGELRGIVLGLATGPGGEPLALMDRGEVFDVGHRGPRPFPGPDGAPLTGVRDLVSERDGTLWAVQGETLWRRGPSGQWSQPLADHPAGEGAARRLSPSLGQGVLLLTTDAVWAVGETVEHLAGVDDPWEAAEALDGTVWVAAWSRLLEIRDGEVIEHPAPGRRPLSILVRDGAAWAAWDEGIATARPGGTAEYLRADEGIPSGGPLLLDREGSLWAGTFLGLVQLPWPEVVTWSARDGLPSSHARYLARTGSRTWVTTWHGLGWFDEGSGTGSPSGVHAKGPICVDGTGTAWTAATYGHTPDERTGSGVIALDEAGIRAFPRGDSPSWNSACSTARDGTVWMVHDQGLVRIPAGGPPGRVEDLPTGERTGRHAVLLASDGTLWASTDGEVCRARAREEGHGPWTCAGFEGGVVLALAETEAGSVWALSRRNGVFRWTSAAWERIPASDDLSSPWLIGMRTAPDGTTWLVGQGDGLRVRDTAGAPPGWEVVEALSPAESAAAAGLSDLVEEADGTRWLASNAGLTRVAAAARAVVASPPEVAVVEARIDGALVPTTGILELDGPGADLTLVFAALSYRSPGQVRYRLRLRPGDPWSEPHADRTLHLAGLGAGRYTIEVAATADGERWSSRPATVEVLVPLPWYLRPWFLLAALAGLAAVGAAAYRIRMAMALRVERLRTRIAMDLHDEVGSGLGSIGLLAGLARSGTVDPERSTALAGRIADTAEELSASMRGIVWSLRPDSGRLDSLASHLVDRAMGLFPGEEVAFEARLPDPVPPTPLALDTLRAAQLIAMEALHNAARHAEASRVVLGLEREGRRWCLWVADDGRGLPTGPGNGGLGRKSMQRRATAIGADLEWRSTPGGGTTVRLVFDARSA